MRPYGQSLWQWLSVLLSGRPHFYIGGNERPYMLRWYLIPRNAWMNVYLHKFMRDDDDRALHDHPWWFVSVMLWGSYLEWRPDQLHAGAIRPRRRGWLSAVFRFAEDRHRVTLDRGPCWTLVITGPKSREWGFWCPQGFVHWKNFVDPTDQGLVGPGCEGEEQ